MNGANFFPIKNAELVEVLITSNSQVKFMFPRDTNVRGRKVTAIEIYKVADLPKAPATGRGNLNATAFKDAFLTLAIAGKEKIKQMPLNTFVAGSNNGLIRSIEPSVIDMDKSSIEFSQTANLTNNTESVLAAFYFEDEKK